MLTREELEAFRDRHAAARDQFFAKGHQCQGAINAVNALIKSWDEAKAKELEKYPPVEPPAFDYPEPAEKN